MKKIYLLFFLVVNIIGAIEIKKNQNLKSFKFLKPEVKQLAENLIDDDFWRQLYDMTLNCGEYCAKAWCEQALGEATIFCEGLIKKIIISQPYPFK